MSRLPRSTAEDQGLSSGALDAFVAALDSSGQEIQTLMVLRHGHVVREEEWSPYRLADPHLLFSVSKSFTSIGIGLAIEAGLLSLDDKVISFFPDELPDQVGDNLAAMEIRHLLTMTTGHDQDTVERLSKDRRMVGIFLGLEVEHEPGTVFVYNSGATYMLSAILQKLTGERLLDFLRPRLFEPLGATEATWEVSREGITTGGWGLSLNTESLARFGQLLLQRGQWEGRQLLPAEWIDAATSKQVDNSNQDNPDWQQGYGYQFWRSRHGGYRGDGAFGQYCLVFPEHDAAVIITSAGFDMQETLDVVWEHFLPVLEGAAPTEARQVGPLLIAPPSGGVPSDVQSGVPSGVQGGVPSSVQGGVPSGGAGRTYRFEENHAGLTAVRLDADGTGTFTFGPVAAGELAASGSQEITIAPGSWEEQAYLLREPKQRIVTNAYSEGSTFVATIRLLETPYVITLACRPTGDALTVDLKFNVAFGPTEVQLVSV
ncbi:serine hydrolase domain-containing protein [Kribbella caucasensis]|uniref:serine hydrolase domain-containing protein n=1 Tax=Kribbella caucasensis TaxID=2512215 RepID=UPI001EE02A55|nr:serine hydrolase [Kribbella sp. VKM Ac-2527]